MHLNSLYLFISFTYLLIYLLTIGCWYTSWY